MCLIEALKQVLQANAKLELAVLIGSRAVDLKATDATTQHTATQHSDWDIAIRWQKEMSHLDVLAQTELLRHKIAEAVHNTADKIDLIDIITARLTMRAVIAEEGITLKGEDTLAWSHFLTQTWAELEDYYWRKQHAA